MPEAAISGVVEGLLQGHAIRQQKQHDSEEKERQHALDIFQQHAEEWKRTQAEQARTDRLAQDKTQNDLDRARIDVTKSQVDARTAEAKARQDLAEGKLKVTSQKNEADYARYLYGQGIPLNDAERLAQMQFSGGASSAAPATPQQPGLQNALGILGQAGQGQAPIPGGGIGANGARPDIMSLLQGSADATGARPQTRTPGLDPSAIGQSPKVAADIAAKQAATAKAEAAIPKLKADAVYAGFHSDWMKLHMQTEKETAKLSQSKVALTHAQTAYKEAMTKIDGDLKKADTMLAQARTTEAIARTEYTHEQIQHTKNMDTLKSASVDLNTETKKANLREKAMKQEGAIAKDRRNQEDALGKMQATLNTYNIISKIDKAHLDPADPKNTPIMVQIDTAKAQIPYLQQRIAETKDRIDQFTKQEKEAHAYVAQTTEMLNKSGTVNKAATEKNRAAADKAAKNPPKLPALSPDFPYRSPGAGRTAPPGAHPKVQGVAPGKTSGSAKTGKLKTMTDAELDALRKKLEHHQ